METKSSDSAGSVIQTSPVLRSEPVFVETELLQVPLVGIFMAWFMFDGKSQHFKQLSPGEFLKVAQDILACVYSYIPPPQRQHLKQRADPAVNFV